MEYQIVSNVSDKVALFIDNDMSVGEVRTIIRVMLDIPDNFVMSMSYNGKQLVQDEFSWREVMSVLDSHSQDGLGGADNQVPSRPPRKIFCHAAARQAQEGCNHEALRATVSDNERLQREQARMMEPMIESMTQNPAFVESILNMNPALKKMAKENPEVAKQMRDPETLKMMMMSQLNPDRRRELNRSLELQLAHISDIPGGQQLLDRYMTGFLRDVENVGSRTEADLHVVSEDAARPDPSKESNSEALPNPWKQPPPNLATNTSSTPIPYLPPNLFRMGNNSSNSQGGSWGGMGLDSHGLSSGVMNNLMSVIEQNPYSAQAPLNMFAANNNNISSNNNNNNAGTSNHSGVSASHVPTVSTTHGWDKTGTNEKSATSHLSGNQRAAYELQMHTLKEMGFEDEELCLRALEATNGDVEEALTYIDEHQSQ